uniref:Uncharacterized protein n=1 Tax=Acrobeloides nanus TaxID=290746 RepID=A0A914E8L5_9BILA
MDPEKLSPPPSPFIKNGRVTISREPSKTPKMERKMSRSMNQSYKSRTTSLNENVWRGVGAAPHLDAPPEIKKTRSQATPGLRAMLYGLAMKTEKEEAALRKIQHKTHCKFC